MGFAAARGPVSSRTGANDLARLGEVGKGTAQAVPFRPLRPVHAQGWLAARWVSRQGAPVPHSGTG